MGYQVYSTRVGASTRKTRDRGWRPAHWHDARLRSWSPRSPPPRCSAPLAIALEWSPKGSKSEVDPCRLPEVSAKRRGGRARAAPARQLPWHELIDLRSGGQYPRLSPRGQEAHPRDLSCPHLALHLPGWLAPRQQRQQLREPRGRPALRSDQAWFEMELVEAKPWSFWRAVRQVEPPAHARTLATAIAARRPSSAPTSRQRF